MSFTVSWLIDCSRSNPDTLPAITRDLVITEILLAASDVAEDLKSTALSVITNDANSQAIGATRSTGCRSFGFVDARKIKSAPYMESRSATRLVGFIFLIVYLTVSIYILL